MKDAIGVSVKKMRNLVNKIEVFILDFKDEIKDGIGIFVYKMTFIEHRFFKWLAYPWRKLKFEEYNWGFILDFDVFNWN